MAGTVIRRYATDEATKSAMGGAKTIIATLIMGAAVHRPYTCRRHVPNPVCRQSRTRPLTQSRGMPYRAVCERICCPTADTMHGRALNR